MIMTKRTVSCINQSMFGWCWLIVSCISLLFITCLFQCSLCSDFIDHSFDQDLSDGTRKNFFDAVDQKLYIGLYCVDISTAIAFQFLSRFHKTRFQMIAITNIWSFLFCLTMVTCVRLSRASAIQISNTTWMPVGDFVFLFSLPLKELEAVLCLFSGDGQLRLVGSVTGRCQPQTPL